MWNDNEEIARKSWLKAKRNLDDARKAEQFVKGDKNAKKLDSKREIKTWIA